MQGVQFEQADCARLPHADGCFDHVFVCFVLEHLARADLVRKEAPGVLLDPTNHQFGSSVVLFTGVIGEGQVAPLIRLRRIGHEVTVVTTAGERHQSDWIGPLAEAGVAVSPVSFYEELAAL